MNLDATLTVQSNQTDQFTIIVSVINCTSFSMKEMVKCMFQCPVSIFIGTGFYRYWFYQWPNYPIALFP